MRILNLGSTFFAEGFKQCGHQVMTAGLDDGCELPCTHPVTVEKLLHRLADHDFMPDCSVWADNGNLPFVLGVERLPFPSLFYSVDTFCNPWHVPYSQAFDGVFVAQQGHVHLFPSELDPQWMPLFAPLPSALPMPGGELRDIPVAFVGTLRPRNIPQRLEFLQAFRRLQPVLLMQGEYTPIFSRTQVVLNQSAASEVNFRCFEAMSCGAALLTEDSCHGLTDLFEPGVHILPLYRRSDAAHAASIAGAWLQRPTALAQIARAGWELVRERHTVLQRAEVLISKLEQLRAEGAPRRRMDELPRRRQLLSTAYGILVAELTDESLQTQRALFDRVFMELIGSEQ